MNILHKKTYATIDYCSEIKKVGNVVLATQELQLYKLVLEDAAPYMKKQKDPAHDIEHATCVIHNALELSVHEGGNRMILIAAGALHDIINYPKGHNKTAESAQEAAALAGKILSKKRYKYLITENQRIRIQDAIANHSLTNKKTQTLLESKIIQDADNLDKLGWRGIIRTAVYAKQRNRDLYDPQDPLAEKRDIDAHKYMLDYFLKLLSIPDKLHTETARQIAPDLMLPIYAMLNGIKQHITTPLLERKTMLTAFSMN